MERGWMMALAVSAALLLNVLAKAKPGLRSFGYAFLHVIAAAVVLFLINGTGLFGDIRIPINLVTVLTVAILGLPGLLLLAAVKWTILPH